MTVCINDDVLLFVVNDIGSQIKVTLTRDDDDSAIDLTDAAVYLRVSREGSKTLLYTVTADAGSAAQRAAGIVIFTFSQSNLDQEPGNYWGEIQISFTSGKIESVYELLNITLRTDIE